MLNAYQKERIELARLGLLVGPSSNPDPQARKGEAQSKQKGIQAARTAYLAEHGAEKIKATFPRMWAECWPGI